MDAQEFLLSDSAALIWWLSLALGMVVSLVVATLLWLIHRTAVGIKQRAAGIWDTGQRVANNTIHIPTLYRVNEAVGGIIDTAGRIEKNAAAIRSHAATCKGCPACLSRR